MPTTDADQTGILPIYLVCDLSASMRGEGRAEALQDALSALRDAVFANPVVSDCARTGVICFASDAWVALPLCDLASVDELPILEPRGLTSYAAAFRLLRKTIAEDVAQLAGDRYRVSRPMVFFVSDGEPTDRQAEWTAERTGLLDDPAGPEIVAFAVGEAKARTMAAVATSCGFIARSGVAVRDAIAGIGDLVVRSVVASSTSGVPAVAGLSSDVIEEMDLL